MSGIIYESVAWIYKMFMTFVIAAVCIMLVANVVQYQLNTITVQEDLVLDRVLYSPDSFWYTNSDGILEPGVVNKQLFETGQLEKNIQFPAGYAGVRLQLYEIGQKTPTEAYVNEQWFTTYSTAYQVGTVGGGSVVTHTYPVTITDNGNNPREGILVVDIAMPEKA